MVKQAMTTFMADKEKTPFTAVLEMIILRAEIMLTSCGATVQTTQPQVEMTRFKGIKEETPSMAAQAVIQSQGEMDRPISFMAVLATT